MIYEKNVLGKIDQGDIIYPVKVNDWLTWWSDDKDYPIIILTPTCDIAQQKADHHRFAILEPFPLFFLQLYRQIVGKVSAELSEITSKQKQRLEDKLRKAIRNSWPRYHFLENDGHIIKTDRIVDFEVIVSAPIDSFTQDFRIARLKSPYKEELIHRYSHHSMRIGTEDIPKDKINEIIVGCFKSSY